MNRFRMLFVSLALVVAVLSERTAKADSWLPS